MDDSQLISKKVNFFFGDAVGILNVLLELLSLPTLKCNNLLHFNLMRYSIF